LLKASNMKDVEIALNWCKLHLQKQKDYETKFVALELFDSYHVSYSHSPIILSDEIVKNLIFLLNKELVPSLELEIKLIESKITDLLESKKKLIFKLEHNDKKEEN